MSVRRKARKTQELDAADLNLSKVFRKLPQPEWCG